MMISPETRCIRWIGSREKGSTDSVRSSTFRCTTARPTVRIPVVNNARVSERRWVPFVMRRPLAGTRVNFYLTDAESPPPAVSEDARTTHGGIFFISSRIESERRLVAPASDTDARHRYTDIRVTARRRTARYGA